MLGNIRREHERLLGAPGRGFPEARPQNQIQDFIQMVGGCKVQRVPNGRIQLAEIAFVVGRENSPGEYRRASAAMVFSRRPPMGRLRPRRVISPVMAMSRSQGTVSAEMTHV